MLATSTFAFSHNVFKNLHSLQLFKGLTLSKTKNFRRFQTGRACTRQFQI